MSFSNVFLLFSLLEYYEPHFWHFLQSWPFEPLGDDISNVSSRARLAAYFSTVLCLVQGPDKRDSLQAAKLGLSICKQQHDGTFNVALISHVVGVISSYSAPYNKQIAVEAREHLHVALDGYRQSNCHLGEAIVLHALVTLHKYDAWGSDDEVVSHLEQALSIFKSLDHRLGAHSCTTYLHKYRPQDGSSTPSFKRAHFTNANSDIPLMDRIEINDCMWRTTGNSDATINLQLPREPSAGGKSTALCA
jgi:hypothetical protein